LEQHHNRESEKQEEVTDAVSPSIPWVVLNVRRSYDSIPEPTP